MVVRGKVCPCCGRRLPETAEEKFERLVDRSAGPDGCWPYRGSRNAAGYGQIDVYLRGKITQVRAHRLAYELAKGPIPQGLFILHACDNRICCNPAHLSLGTAADNHADMWARGRQQDYTLRKRTSRSGLDADKVIEMRARFRAGENTTVIGAAYGISQAAAWNAIHGKTWQHVPGAVIPRGRGFRHPTIPPSD